MKIGILGAGAIGKTLAQKLTVGHDVKVANSRGPETIGLDALASGARAVDAAFAVQDVDVVIISIPLSRLAAVAPLIRGLPADTVVIDTSNYYPFRDGLITDLEAGQVESVWVSELLGRPIAKAWNAIGAASLAERARAPGSPGRIAIPVAADTDRDRRTAMALVEDTGFEAVDAGGLAQSWRQQPGAPGYCTDLIAPELADALAAAERERLPKRRDFAIAVGAERMSGADVTRVGADYVVRLSRALYM